MSSGKLLKLTLLYTILYMKNKIETTGAPKADAILSQAIEADGMIFVSGQIHQTPDGQLIEGSITEKVAQIMSNIEAILNG